MKAIYKLPKADKWYEHKPQTVTKYNNITVLWEIPVNTDKAVKANRPDIIIENRKTENERHD